MRLILYSITAVQDYEMHYMNAWLKRCVINLDSKRGSVSEPRTLSRRLFQSLGAKYEKAPPPLVDFAILGTTKIEIPLFRRRRRKGGKRAGVLVRLRRRAFRHPLPTILLANVQSLDNKLCELWARISYQRETRDCCVICLKET